MNYWFLILILIVNTVSASASESRLSKIEAACSKDENWAFLKQINQTQMSPRSRAMLKSLEKGPPHGKIEALNAISLGYNLKSERSKFLREFGNYLVYRSYFELNLVHLSYHL